MLSLRQSVALTASPAPQTSTTGNALQPSILELPSLSDSLDTFVSIVSKEFQAGAAVKLCCSLPSYEEWCAGTNLDMHDLFELHAKLICFLRGAVQRLRALKISATYHLSPAQSDSSVALVRAVPPSPVSNCSSVWSDPACVSSEQLRPEDRSKAFLTSIGNVPTLITS